MSKLDFLPANILTEVEVGQGLIQIVILEDNEAVIKTTKKGRSLTMRHITRTRKITLDWLYERIRDDLTNSIRYVGTKLRMVDFLTKGAFPGEQWAPTYVS